MEEKTIENPTWPLSSKIAKNEFTILVESYVAYAAKMKYVRYLIFGVVAVILIYNLFVAGKRFPIEELNRIQTGFAVVMGLFVIALLVLAGIMISLLRKLKKDLNTTAEKYKLDKKGFRKEFHKLVKSTIGGPGLR
jgi:uncharacterized membrane protein